MGQADTDLDSPRAREVPDPVQWSEGMLLTPQHFQQASLRNEVLLSYQIKLAAPFHWGVRTLDIDPAALVGGLFRVQRLEAVMPDGLVIDHSPRGSTVLTLELESAREEMQLSPVAVYVAVAARHVEGASVEGTLMRYDSVDGQPVADENTGKIEEHIPRLRPRLHLFVGPKPSPSYVSMPLARVSYSNEAYALSPYVPPLIAVARDSPIGKKCGELAARLREKAAYLAERVSSPEVTASISVSVETTRQIHALTGALPPFETLLETGVCHPLPLYAALWGLVGQVAGVATATVPPVPEPYDHNDLLRVFEAANGVASDMLEQVREAYTVLRFNFVERAFRLRLPGRTSGRQLTIGVRLASGVPRESVVRWITRSLIGTAGHERSMRERRVTGAPRKRISADPELGVVPPPGVLLFGIELDPQFIEPGDTLVIRNLAETAERERPAEIVLYVASATE